MNTYIARIIQLLIFNNGEVTFDFLMEQLQISKRMIDYYLNQFVEWIEDNAFPSIAVYEDTVVLSCEDYEKFFNEFVSNFDVCNYYLSAVERQCCIVLLIGLSSSKIKIDSLIDHFSVSKNTITNDLLVIKETLSNFNVFIESKGKSGYYFSGNEQDIRYLLMQCYHHHDNAMFHKYLKEFLLNELESYGINTINIINEIHNILMDAEKLDNEEYIFLALYDLIETILLIICRMHKATIMSEEQYEDFFTPSLKLIVNSLKEFDINYEKDEMYYLYLILQSAKVSRYNPNEFSKEVIELTNDIVNYFKSISQLNIFSQTEIYNMFLIHVKSMYFRTKHKIKITNFRDTSSNDLFGFYCIAKKVLEKVGSKYNLSYDDDEIKFLSYYFASLEYANEPTAEAFGKVVIVCVSGLGSSMYLKSQCLKIFDNSISIVISDLKNLTKNIDSDTKLIVSTVNVGKKILKEIPFKRVHPVLTDKEKQELSEWFYMNRFSFNKEVEVIRDVLDIINECAVIKNKNKLFHDLNQYFNPAKKLHLLHLEDIFESNSIVKIESIESLEQFIYKSGQPLIDKKSLSMTYLDNVIEVLNQHGPYCECFEGILVAHAIPNKDVSRPCLSLGICEEGFVVNKWNNKRIKAIFILGVTDTETHANAFSELINNLTKNNLYQDINCFDNYEDLYQKIVLP